MNLSLIVAVSQNGVIGRDNALPWHLPEDLKRFRALTWGHHIIMGRKTYESLGRLLPGRTSVIVTRNPDFDVTGARIARSLDEALQTAADDDQPFVIGGAALFAAALPRADRIYLTRVLVDCDGDITLDLPIDESSWVMIDQGPVQHSAKDGTPYRYEEYRRVAGVDFGKPHRAR